MGHVCACGVPCAEKMAAQPGSLLFSHVFKSILRREEVVQEDPGGSWTIVKPHLGPVAGRDATKGKMVGHVANLRSFSS